MCRQLGIYLMNSVNPFRLEGQKSIMYRILEARDWQSPDWVIVPGGNLGNCSAFGKGIFGTEGTGLDQKDPAAGGHQRHRRQHAERAGQRAQTRTGRRGNTMRSLVQKHYAAMDESNYRPHTVASAIEISRPVNLPKALRALDVMNGVALEVSDDEILEHRAMVARWGFGCEPASAASVAGLQKLRESQTIGRGRNRRLHSDRPRTERPQCDGEISHRRGFERRPGLGAAE